MNKILLVLGIGIVGLGLWMMGGYNGLVAKDEGVQQSWSEVQNQYQRRMDLIPNLVRTVKGSAAFEQETLTAVINARASATKMDVNLKNAQEMAEFQNQQTGISQALGRLIMVTENYPTLQASAAFKDLMVQLEGTENRITVARNRYTQEVKTFNTAVRTFPTNITAMILGFEKYENFAAEAGADKAPVVDFK